MFDHFTAYKRCAAAILLLTVLGGAQGQGLTSETPVVFWQSQPVSPGELVVVDGHAFDTNASIQWQRLPDVAPGSPGAAALPTAGYSSTRVMRARAQQLSYVLPTETSRGVFAWRVRNVNGKLSAPRLLNGPEAWFMQADVGRRASQGGWFVLHGHQLQYGSGQPGAALMQGGVLVTVLTARTGGNAYEQTFDLPAQLAAGSYDLYIHNGSGGPSAWVSLASTIRTADAQLIIADNASLWDSVARSSSRLPLVIDVAQGLPSNKSWDDIFDAALAQLYAQGGGVLSVRAGTYPMTRRIVLPDHTIMVGEGMDRTVLRWDAPFVSADPESARSPLVRGRVIQPYPYVRGTFSLEGLTLTRTYEEATTADSQGLQRTAGAVCIERTSTVGDDQYAYFRHVACRAPNTAQNTREFSASFDPNWTKRAAVYLNSSRSTEITDCVFDYSGGIYLNGDNGRENAYVRIDRNHIYWRGSPLDQSYGVRGLRFAGNTQTMRGSLADNGFPSASDVGIGLGSFQNNLRDVYIGNNRSLRDGPGTPEPVLGLTTDGLSAAYLGHVVSGGTTQHLSGRGGAGDVGHTGNTDQYGRPFVQPGAMVQIVAGRGAGQWRELVSSAVNVSSVQIDRPWDVKPDSSSWLEINDMLGRMLIVNNDLSNAPKLQLYFATHDVVVAGNAIGHGGSPGYFALWRGMLSDNGAYMSLSRGLHIQYLDNVVGANGLRFIESGFGNFSAMESRGIYLDASLTANLDAFAAPLVFRNNRRDGAAASGSLFNVDLNPLRQSVALDHNAGVSAVRFVTPLAAAPWATVRQVSGLDGHPTPLVESSAGMTLDAGSGVFYSFSGINKNFARGGLTSAINDAGTWGRKNVTDGVSVGDPDAIKASSGGSNSPWIQVDLRESVQVKSIVIKPVPNNVADRTSNMYIVVSPTPFVDTDLTTARSRLGVNSVYISGPINAETTFTISPAVSGRYVRVWRELPGGATGYVQFAEIEVYGDASAP